MSLADVVIHVLLAFCLQPELLALLAYELANEQKMINGRVLAGLYLKNTLTAKVGILCMAWGILSMA